MKRFVEHEERSQIILFPKRLDDYVNEDNLVRVVVDSLIFRAFFYIEDDNSFHPPSL